MAKPSRQPDFSKTLATRSRQESVSKPQLFRLARPAEERKLRALITSGKASHIVDDYEEQLHELFAVNNPTLVYASDFESKFRAYLTALSRKAPLWRQGVWVFYPWLSNLVHVLEEKDFVSVRTARNRNLISAEEQKKFYDAVIGIAGLSVGNSVALAIALQGGGRHVRLADMDRLALSNTNRVRAGVQNLGLLKVELTARQIYEINPYTRIDIFPEGLQEGNIARFFEGGPKLDIVIDEVDNLAVKFLIREQARKHRLAVVMAADNGDNGVVDVERYDQNPRIPFFHGRMGKVSYAQLKSLNKFATGALIAKYVGPENVTQRMQESLYEMGKTIVSWPQLGGAAILNGVAVAYCVRRILNGQALEPKRALVSLDEKLIPNYFSPRETKKRAAATKVFARRFGLRA